MFEAGFACLDRRRDRIQLRFTIGIPVKNGEQYLADAIRSAVQQTRPADEIVVLDDASSDGSAATARSPRWGGRVRYVFNDRSTGFADAFNRIAAIAEGDYVIILGADDVLDVHALSALEEGLLAFPGAGLCYAGYWYIDEKGRKVSSSPPPFSTEAVLHEGQAYSHAYLKGVHSGEHVHRCAGFAVDRILLRDRCPFRREAGLIADDDFFVRLGSLTTVVGISQPLVSVRRHSGAISSNIESLSLQLAEDYLVAVRTHATNPHNVLPQSIVIYHDLAARFLDALFLESLRRGRPQFLQRAFELQKQFDVLVPDYRREVECRWTERVWYHAANHTFANLALRSLVTGAGGIRMLRNGLLRNGSGERVYARGDGI